MPSYFLNLWSFVLFSNFYDMYYLYLYFYCFCLNSFVIKCTRFMNFCCISSSIEIVCIVLLIFLFISGCSVDFLVLFFRALLILFLLYTSFPCCSRFILNWTFLIFFASLVMVSFLSICKNGRVCFSFSFFFINVFILLFKLLII
uniref:Uncharacterized protein n=1 Tax=Schizaphis graminum TaxID=13262 RepID=A0A2S2NCL3_SCHGA